jgi:putative hemolysin
MLNIGSATSHTVLAGEMGGTMKKLIDLSTLSANPLANALIRLVRRPVERLLALDRTNRYYDRLYQAMTLGDPDRCAFETSLDILKVRYRVNEQNLNRIPEKGPLVMVANHPFGGIEGLILGALLLRRRNDVRILGNFLLKYIIGVRDRIIAVDPFGNSDAAKANRSGLKQSLAWLKNGGALITFPAGEVASWKWSESRVTDPEWNSHIGAFIRLTKATTVPVHFPGRNGNLFHLMGMLHPLLRTVLLPRELMNKRRKTLPVHVGSPIAWKQLARCSDDAAITKLLRFNTDILQARTQRHPPRFNAFAAASNRLHHQEPIIESEPADRLAREVGQLPDESRLIACGDFAVYIAQSRQIPRLLNEIGRQREITFREVGEGTGRTVDLDRFDDHYLHLFLWNHAASELVGAYRLGLVDQILSQFGPKGLYTSELFRYKPEFISQLNRAIEFGRSFIRSEYQKKYNSLILIWRGIGEFIGRHPQYHILFGPVSISRNYHNMSKTLLVRFLKRHNFHPSLSEYVRPRRPFRCPRIGCIDQTALLSTFRDIDDISLLISEIEKDGKGVPVLLKHYLKLNGRLLSFNLDKAFSNALDGLLLVDLRQTDPKILRRFIGLQGAEQVLNGGQMPPQPDPANLVLKE